MAGVVVENYKKKTNPGYFHRPVMASQKNMDTIIHSRRLPSEDTKNKSEVTYEEKSGDLVVGVEELQPGPPSGQGFANKRSFTSFAAVIWKFGRFMGPGTIISVAYIDPDNFQTAISSGAQFQYKLLFMVLLSNAIAIFLQVSHFAPDADLMLSLQVARRQVGNCNWDGLGTDEQSQSSKVAQLLIVVYGRSHDCLHRYWTSKD